MSQEPPINPYASPSEGYQPNRQAAMAQVSAPATGLIITGALGIAIQVILIALNLLGIGVAAVAPEQQGGPEAINTMVGGTISVVFGLLAIGIGGLIVWGAMRMKALENYGLAMTISILAAVPCLSPCCLFGLPIGIWSIVVLMNDNVKRSFS